MIHRVTVFSDFGALALMEGPYKNVHEIYSYVLSTTPRIENTCQGKASGSHPSLESGFRVR
jgi:hypothetical protein